MKAVIGRKLYNTEKAEKLHWWCTGRGTGDLNYCEEVLFRTQKGAFFVHGKGGALTQCATWYGDSRGYGEDIVPLSAEEAREWLQEHKAGPATIQRFFEIEEA